MNYTTVYLGIGGNMPSSYAKSDYAQPEYTIASALNAVRGIRGVDWRSFRVSKLYETEPVIVPGEPLSKHKSGNYVNAVCSFKTTVAVAELFGRLENIERHHDKYYYSDKGKNDPRPIDIDVLFYGDFVGKVKLGAGRELEIPHSQWSKRLFVLIPLADLTKTIALQDSPASYLYKTVDILGMINVKFAAKAVKRVAQMKSMDLESLMNFMGTEKPPMDTEKSLKRLSGCVPGSPEQQSTTIDFDKPRRNSGRNADEMVCTDDELKSSPPQNTPPLTRAAAKKISNPPKVPDEIVKSGDAMEIC